MKTIVTHFSPDLDAITSSWLVQKYLPGWDKASFAFVPAGGTLNEMKPDEDENIIHVDTGLGRFDHHQFQKRWSATKRVFEFLAEEGFINEKDLKAIEEMTGFVNEIDNFGEVNFPDPTHIRHKFSIHEFLHHMRGLVTSDEEILRIGFMMLESVLLNVKLSLIAEDDIREGMVMQTTFGKTLVLESQNETAMTEALKLKYELVARRDPQTGAIRIKTLPDRKYDLTPLYEKLKEKDPKATWFLHASRNMLLNGSSKNPNTVPSSLSLQSLVKLLKEI